MHTVAHYLFPIVISANKETLVNICIIIQITHISYDHLVKPLDDQMFITYVWSGLVMYSM